MINLFQLAPNDQAINYLSQIFGPMNGVLAPGSTSSTSAITLFGTMFKTFNSVVLAVGALLVIYVTIIGVMATAHEGEFMGKKWNNIWIPIRMVLGIAALVPTGSGYSAIQIVMMWVIVQGIGAADVVWNTVLNYVSIVGSPYAQVTIPSVGSEATINDLFQGLVCDATARVSSPNPTDIRYGGYYCSGKNSGYCSSPSPTISSDTAVTSLSLGPAGGACGTLKYCDESKLCTNTTSSSLECLSCQAQIVSLKYIVPTLASIAQQFVQVDYNYRDFYYNSSIKANSANWTPFYNFCSAQNPPIPRNKCCVASTSPFQICQANNGEPGNPNMPSPNAGEYPQNASNDAVKNLYWPYGMQNYAAGDINFINTLVTYYTDALTGAAVTYIAAQGESNPLSGQLADAAKTGWIFAGSYYYAIAKTNQTNLSNAIPPMSFENPTIVQGTMNNYRNNYDAAGTLLVVAGGGGGGDDSGSGSIFAATGSGSGSGLGKIGGAFRSVSMTIMKTFATAGNTLANPLTAMQMSGAVILMSVFIFFGILVGITFGLGILGYFDAYVLGTGASNSSGPAFAMTYFLLIPAIFGFMAIMIVIGGTLAVYLPLLPYVIFTFGAIGWLMSVVETMVASPLVALGILSPSGHHELLGKAEPAIMFLFDVFLRPSLMIFGLVTTMLLLSVVINMINAAFWSTVVAGIFGPVGTASTTTSGAIAQGWALLAVNPLELIIYLCAYVAVIFASVNKCCVMGIVNVPQGALKLLGAQGAQYGEQEGATAAKEGVSSGTGGVKGGVSGGRAMGAKGGQAAHAARQPKGTTDPTVSSTSSDDKK